PWRKIDVQIPVRNVAPIVYLNRLFVFWTEIVTTPKNEVKNASSEFVGYKHKITLKYTTLRLDGTWTPPQTLPLSGTPFFVGEGIIDDPLAEEAERTELAAAEAQHPPDPARMDRAKKSVQNPHYDITPRRDIRTHPEPIDGYTLT